MKLNVILLWSKVLAALDDSNEVFNQIIVGRIKSL